MKTTTTKATTTKTTTKVTTTKTTTKAASKPKATTTKTTKTTTKAASKPKATTTKTTKKTTTVQTTAAQKSSTSCLYSPAYFQNAGVIKWNGWRWTWYSQKVLPGHGLKIPGRHVDEKGYVCDGNNYICLASSKLSKGTIVDTPFGKQGKVYDCGCPSNTLDVYVNW